MISPQMSAWVRVWAWVSEAGDSPFFQVAHRCSEPAAGPADLEGRRAAGWRRGLRTCFGPLRRPSRQRSGVQLGMAAFLSEKKPPQQFFKGGETGKEAFARRRCRGQCAAGSGSVAGPEASPCSAESDRQSGIRGDPRGPPGSSAGSGIEESFPGYSPCCSAPRCTPVAAVRSSDKRSAFWRSVVSCY